MTKETTNNKTLKVFTAFSGYDSQCMALDRLGIDYDLVGWSEIDKYAIMAHNAVYPQWADRNFGDISKVDWNNVPDFDLFTYSYPCQDISSAGQQKGLAEDSGTRSSLLWECRKAIETKRPKYLLMENVKALTQKKFLPYLHKWQDFLTSLGYTNFTEVLNAKDFGVPQNRERVFMVSILGDAWFHFPYTFPLKKRLKDVLEKSVDEKYYLTRTNEKLKSSNNKREEIKIIETGLERYRLRRLQEMIDEGKINKDKVEFLDVYNKTTNSEISGTITTRVDASNSTFIAEPKIIQVCNIVEAKNFNNPQRGRVYSPNGISPNIDTMGGGNQEPKIIEQAEDIEDRLNNVCLEVYPQISGKENINEITDIVNDYRIRKLTPRECFRLMGVSETDIDKIQSAGISRTQQYKLAGNSIVVDVLYYIFKYLFR